jgi:hypothetical protein
MNYIFLGFVTADGRPTTLEPTVNRPTPPKQEPPLRPPNFCQQSQTKLTTDARSCVGDLLFDGTFTKSIDSNDKWNAEVRFPQDPVSAYKFLNMIVIEYFFIKDYPFVVYSDDNTNLFVTDGTLHIKPTLLESKYKQEFVHESLDLTPVYEGFFRN